MKTNITTSIALKSVLFFVVTMFAVVSVSGLTPIAVETQISETPGPQKSVVYESVTATTTEKSVVLNWNTISEFNNNHFEVERSTDMTNFKTIAVVLDGFITEGTGKRYAFKEDNAVVKNNQVTYYRLKQFDSFGNVSYSAVVKVQQTPAL